MAPNSKITFRKMHGAGNDYVLLDGRQSTTDWSSLAREMSNRRFGIGFDGLIVADISMVADARMRMWNPDGSESEMCGNGIRCFVKFGLEADILNSTSESLQIETGAGILGVRPNWTAGSITSVAVEMGKPVLSAALLPVDLTFIPPSNMIHLDKKIATQLGISLTDILFDRQLDIGGTGVILTGVSMGNPHVITFIDSPIDDFPLHEIGPMIEHHPAFPNRTNFHIVNIQDSTTVVMRSWERGAGETLACGTGACATVVAGRLHGSLGENVDVYVPGGMLAIKWDLVRGVEMTGPVAAVFDGHIDIPGT